MNQFKSYILRCTSHPLTWICAGIIPSLLALLYAVAKQHHFDQVQNEALYLKGKKEWAQKKQKKEQEYLTQIKKADHDYLEKEIESVQLLSNEVQKLQALVHSEPSNTQYQTRLEQLQSGENRLHFKEQNFQRLDHLQEVEAITEHPVEMNDRDLSQLLAKIENAHVGHYHPGKNPPDLLITKFELSKKPLTSNEEHFVIQLELIKREYVE